VTRTYTFELRNGSTKSRAPSKPALDLKPRLVEGIMLAFAASKSLRLRRLSLVGGCATFTALICLGPLQGRPAAIQKSDSTSSDHFRLTGRARLAVERAVAGARRRLTNQGCQAVLNDFVDGDKRRLTEPLARTGRSAAEYLDDLYFVEGNVSAACLKNRTRLAFTASGSRVIYMCDSRFVPYAMRNATGADMIIIHELLHALGLGENPPTSADITDHVRARCGDGHDGPETDQCPT
jgi:hypothetical protein